jgi:hypothetical protein
MRMSDMSRLAAKGCYFGTKYEKAHFRPRSGDFRRAKPRLYRSQRASSPQAGCRRIRRVGPAILR